MTATMQIIALINTNGVERSEKIVLKAGETVTLGRGWHNDVIINDQYIDPSHLSISLDESSLLKVRDLDSKNGSSLDKNKVNGDQIYKEGSTIYFGETELRFYDTARAVEPALPLDSTHAFARRYNSAGIITTLTLSALAALLVFLYLFETDKFTASTVFSTLTAFVITGITWTFFAAFVGKLFRRETNIGMHWSLLCLATIVVTVLRFPLDIAKFNLDSTAMSSIIDQSFLTIGIAIFAYATLSFTTRLNKKKKWLSALVLALVPQVIFAASPILKEERELWSAEANSNRVTQVPALMWRSSEDLDTHINKLDDLFNDLEEEIKTPN